MSKSEQINLTQSEYEELLNDQKLAQKVRERQKYYTRKRNAVLMIYKNKAKELGIPEPTEDEITEYLNNIK